MITEEKIIKNKLGLIKLASTLGNVSQACYEQGGGLALQEISRKKPCIKNRVEEHVEKAVVEFAIEKPAYGQLKTSNELKKKGLFVSPSKVRPIWLRHDLEIFKERLKALEKAKERIPRRDREPAPWLSGSSGYLLRGHAQGCWQDLPAVIPVILESSYNCCLLF